MERDYNKELRNFQAVWKRVSGEQKIAVGSAKLMPRKEPKSRATRFNPPR